MHQTLCLKVKCKGLKGASHHPEHIAKQNIDIGSQFWLHTRVTWAGEKNPDAVLSLALAFWSERSEVWLKGEPSEQHTLTKTALKSFSEIYFTPNFLQNLFINDILRRQRWGGLQSWDRVSPFQHTLWQLKWVRRSTGGLMGELAPNLICLQLITRKRTLFRAGSLPSHNLASRCSQATPSSWDLLTKKTWALLQWNTKFFL